MIIKILGTGCKKCVALTESAQQAVSNLGIDAQIVKVTDMAEIAAHGVMTTPALAVDDKVVSMGKALTPADIEKLLKAR